MPSPGCIWRRCGELGHGPFITGVPDDYHRWRFYRSLSLGCFCPKGSRNLELEGSLSLGAHPCLLCIRKHTGHPGAHRMGPRSPCIQLPSYFSESQPWSCGIGEELCDFGKTINLSEPCWWSGDDWFWLLVEVPFRQVTDHACSRGTFLSLSAPGAAEWELWGVCSAFPVVKSRKRMFSWQTHSVKLTTPTPLGPVPPAWGAPHLLLLVPAAAQGEVWGSGRCGALSPVEEMRACGRCVCSVYVHVHGDLYVVCGAYVHVCVYVLICVFMFKCLCVISSVCLCVMCVCM